MSEENKNDQLSPVSSERSDYFNRKKCEGYDRTKSCQVFGKGVDTVIHWIISRNAAEIKAAREINEKMKIWWTMKMEN